MKRLYPVWIAMGLCLLPFTGRAQSMMDLVGSARSGALGHATSALIDEVGAASNPAAHVSHRIVQLFVRESYGLRALRLGMLSAAFPTSLGTVAGTVGTFGFDAYREVYADLSFARAFSLGTTRSLHAGLRARYYHTRIAQYGSAGALGLSMGVQVQVLPTLAFGAQAINLNSPALAENEDLPRVLALGMSYRAAPSLLIVTDAFHQAGYPLSIRGGVEAALVPAFLLRAGITTAPTRFTAGAGLRLGLLQVNLAAEQHQALGWSPSVGLRVNW